MIREAICEKCDETFNPADDNDLEHVERQDGTPCGGQGVMQGSYLQPGDNAAWRCPKCGGGDIHAFHCPDSTGTYRT